MDRIEILNNIYNNPKPNRFLASFKPFLLKYAKEPVCEIIIRENFRNFFQYYVLKYPAYRSGVKISSTGPLHVGSARTHGGRGNLNIGIEKIVQHPMEDIVNYHCAMSSDSARKIYAL